MVDELLGRILNETNCTLPVRKLGQSQYMFGTSKIQMQAKVNTLLVRVGGGYSDFREYLNYHGKQEADKIQAAMDEGTWNEEEVFQFFLGKVNPHLAKQRGTVAVPKDATSRMSMSSGAMSDATSNRPAGSPRAGAQNTRSSPTNSSRASVAGKKKK